jgi:hypothetical protein
VKPEDQFHVGIVAEDFEATLAALSAAFGYQWCAEMGGSSAVRLADGEAVLNFGCVYSLTSPRVEIVRRIPGTFWEPTAGSGIHHVGYWSDDVAADSEELERHGYVREAVRPGPGGFAFYRSASGFRVELVSRVAQPSMERLWAGGGAVGGRGSA